MKHTLGRLAAVIIIFISMFSWIACESASEESDPYPYAYAIAANEVSGDQIDVFDLYDFSSGVWYDMLDSYTVGYNEFYVVAFTEEFSTNIRVGSQNLLSETTFNGNSLNFGQVVLVLRTGAGFTRSTMSAQEAVDMGFDLSIVEKKSDGNINNLVSKGIFGKK